MVWRSGSEVLRIKAKASPLLISMLLHVVVLSVFATLNYKKERIFTVELVMEESNISWQSSAGGRHLEKKQSIQRPPALQPAKSDVQMAKPALNSKEILNTESQSVETLPMQEEPSLSGAEENLSGDVSGGISDNLVLTSGGDNESSGSYGGRGNNSGRDFVEGEFGSINGPSFLKMVKPEYPRLARRLGKEGKVKLMLFIDEYGRLLNVEIIEKAGYGFDEAAAEAVKASTFRPARLNGHPVPCKAILPVRFKLE